MSQTLNTRAALTGVLKTFSACEPLCGWDAARVRNVIPPGPGTAVRHAPEEMLGIVKPARQDLS